MSISTLKKVSKKVPLVPTILPKVQILQKPLQKPSFIGENLTGTWLSLTIIFSCSTTGKPSNQFPDEASLKIYFDGAGKNFTDLANIDEELTEQGVRYPVYAWVQKNGYYAKFEQFLGDLGEDFSKFPGSFTNPTTRNEVIKRIAELHSASKFCWQSMITLVTKLWHNFRCLRNWPKQTS